MLALQEEVWQLENQLKDRDDVIKMAVEKEEEKESKIETETEREMETEKENEIQALKEKVEQLENQLKDKDDVITKEQVCTRSLHQEPETRRSSEVEVNKDKENENEKVLASGPKGDETAAGENSNYGTELQKGGGRDELEEREEVEKPPPSPFFYSSKQTPPLSPFSSGLNTKFCVVK
ncbi:unnamed protein product, partial [Pleuronectes platessa]